VKKKDKYLKGNYTTSFPGLFLLYSGIWSWDEVGNYNETKLTRIFKLQTELGLLYCMEFSQSFFSK